MTGPAIGGREASGPVDGARAVEPGVATDASAAAASSSGGTVFTAPAKAAPAGSRQEFLTGVAVGAGLVVLGVVVGGVFGRRR